VEIDKGIILIGSLEHNADIGNMLCLQVFKRAAALFIIKLSCILLGDRL